jgi:effector-binding domain-containing protein
MEYQVRLERVEPQLTAVIRGRAKQSDLPTVVPAWCGEVWNFARAANLPKPGRHVALYLNGQIDLEVGAEVTQPFTGDGRVVCSQLPAGLVATAAHVGPYHLLGGAHSAVVKWCKDNGHTLAGPSWEVYGHWDDDPAKLRTDVFVLLQEGGGPSPG